jgi:hypothetical protein
LNNGINAGRVTMRSLGASANPEASAEIYLNIGGTKATFAQISERISQGRGNAALQNILPNIAKLENSSPVATANIQVEAISQLIEFAPVGKMTDISNAKLDALIRRVADRADIAIEIKGNLDGSELEVNRLMGLRSYLMQKGIGSDRILISNSDSQTQASTVTVTLANLEGLPIAKLPDDPDQPTTPPVTIAQRGDRPEIASPNPADTNTADRANSNRLSLLFREEFSLDTQPSSFTTSQINFGGNGSSTFSRNNFETNSLAQSSFFLLGQLLDLDNRLALLPRTANTTPPLLFTDFIDNTISLTPVPNLLLGQLLDPETYTRQPLALLPPNLLPSNPPLNSPQILSLLLEPTSEASRFSFLISTATEAQPQFSFRNASADTTGILWSYTPTDQMLSLLLTEPTTIVATNDAPDLRTQRFISALNFLMNRDRDVLTSWLNSLNGQQPELRGEVIRPELFEGGQL